MNSSLLSRSILFITTSRCGAIQRCFVLKGKPLKLCIVKHNTAIFYLHYDRFREEEMTTTHQHHFMPFGQGPRNCIGFRLAMIEMKTALATLLREHRFTAEKVRNRFSLSMQLVDGKLSFLISFFIGLFADRVLCFNTVL